MPKVKYVAHGGKETVVDIPAGFTAMEGAVKNSISGIDADCGGACACATCHVYVDPAFAAKIPPKSEIEESMLDFAIDVKPHSRLSCQIKITQELDGLVLHMPKSQH